MSLCDLVGRTSRCAEQSDKLRHEDTGPREMKIQQSGIQFKPSLRKQPHDRSPKHGRKRRGTGRRQPHDDVLIMIRTKPKKGRHRGIELAERMRQRCAIKHGDLTTGARSHQGGISFGCAIDDENGRLLERRHEERTRGMTEMVIQKDGANGARIDPTSQFFTKPEQFHPLLAGALKRACPFDAKELSGTHHGRQGESNTPADLPVLPWHDDGLDITKRHPAFAQAIADRLNRKSRHMFLPNESFLLGRSGNATVAHECGGGISHIRQAQHHHGAPPSFLPTVHCKRR